MPSFARPSGLWLAVTLLSAGPALAVDPAACEAFCVERGAALAAACEELGCQEEVEGHVANCVKGLCFAQVAPTADQVAALARRHAEAAFGGPLHTYDVIDQMATDDVVLSRLFVFTPHADVAPPAALMAQFAANPGARQWQDLFRCVEVGVGPETPPVIGYWRGLPAEYALTQKARAALAREVGDDAAARAEVVRRYGPAITPLLALRLGERTWYFDTSSRDLLPQVEIRRREAREDDRERTERRIKFKALWLNRLAELTEE